MEAISNHARKAAEQEKQRRYTAADLEEHVGVTVDQAYLLSNSRHENTILVPRNITHEDEPLSNGEWRKSVDENLDNFLNRTIIEFDLYQFSAKNGLIILDDEPFESNARIRRQGLSAFRRKSPNATCIGATPKYSESSSSDSVILTESY